MDCGVEKIVEISDDEIPMTDIAPEKFNSKLQGDDLINKTRDFLDKCIKIEELLFTRGERGTFQTVNKILTIRLDLLSQMLETIKFFTRETKTTIKNNRSIVKQHKKK